MDQSLPGEPGQIAVHRAVTELRGGRPVVLLDETALLAVPLEGLDDERLSHLRAAGAALAVSASRAAMLGLAPRATVFELPDGTTTALLMSWAGGHQSIPGVVRGAGSPGAAAAIELAKLAQILPSLLVLPIDQTGWPGLQRVAPGDIARFQDMSTDALRLVSRARVPLRRGGESEFVVFRDVLGRTSNAVIVGRPDLSRPVPVRLHSACLTGDAFASLRCDCGDQLNMALDIMRDGGGGVLLYLDQEGCGIGLANKMRAYRLQDLGLDTIDANMALGFGSDERTYGEAARMLDLLGISSVLLLTNNPGKLDALSAAGIRVAGRLPLVAPVNMENRRYLEAKAARVGHMLGSPNTEPRHALV